jgi:hypothetical protein
MRNSDKGLHSQWRREDRAVVLSVEGVKETAELVYVVLPGVPNGIRGLLCWSNKLLDRFLSGGCACSLTRRY